HFPRCRLRPGDPAERLFRERTFPGNKKIIIMERKEYLHRKISEIHLEIGKAVIGQEHLVNRLLIGLFTDGHILLEGVPGLAKTKTINSLAQVLDLGFQRIQFTPDLLPSDLVGTMIYNQK